jgi:hypothetical protein
MKNFWDPPVGVGKWFYITCSLSILLLIGALFLFLGCATTKLTPSTATELGWTSVYIHNNTAFLLQVSVCEFTEEGMVDNLSGNEYLTEVRSDKKAIIYVPQNKSYAVGVASEFDKDYYFTQYGSYETYDFSYRKMRGVKDIFVDYDLGQSKDGYVMWQLPL